VYEIKTHGCPLLKKQDIVGEGAAPLKSH